jgi:23S rRNA (guanine2445-N2)-methyltransferase / 23S rRNA (guanine2069-N7)-methyltransferase
MSDASISNQYEVFVTCPRGIESLLLAELAALGIAGKETRQGVTIKAGLKQIYQVCMWSRLANRVLLLLDEVPAATAGHLYDGVMGIDWLSHFSSTASLRVDFNGTSAGIQNTHFGALKVKDAIVDQIRERTGERPNIEKDNPDMRINVHVRNNHARVSLDMSGDSLHRRGYRLAGGHAPLKENLAAALLVRAGWPALAKEQKPLLDPMCGSGTLLLEGLLIAADIAPGLLRNRFGFSLWKGHETKIFNEIKADAEIRREKGIQQCPKVYGYDASSHALEAAMANAKRAGVESLLLLKEQPLQRLEVPEGQGLFICNPPYGERLGEVSTLLYLYQNIGRRLKQDFVGWDAAVFTGNPELGKRMGIKACKRYKFWNGALEAILLMFDVSNEYFIGPREESVEQEDVVLSAGSKMFANRLMKNKRAIAKWVKKEKITCYRLYDADMPEYAVAIDIYQDKVLVQEYQAPKSVDAQKAQERLMDVVTAIPSVLNVNANDIVLKQRQRQTGTNQYEKQDSQGKFFTVEEGDVQLLANLDDYLDTGVFLDHRNTRLEIGNLAKGKSFLNLFSYTCAATVHAAVGGATNTTSVDMSNTYLDWGKRNLALNGFDEQNHEMIQADCIQWLERATGTYDLIFLDPPTFSNSKRMKDVLDIQRDHVQLIKHSMALLADDGLLIFSNNLKRFHMDRESLEGYEIVDKTAASIGKDFQRNQKIHNCWHITKGVDAPVNAPVNPWKR